MNDIDIPLSQKIAYNAAQEIRKLESQITETESDYATALVRLYADVIRQSAEQNKRQFGIIVVLLALLAASWGFIWWTL